MPTIADFHRSSDFLARVRRDVVSIRDEHSRRQALRRDLESYTDGELNDLLVGLEARHSSEVDVVRSLVIGSAALAGARRAC